MGFLEVVYEHGPAGETQLRRALDEARWRSVWRFRAALPPAGDEPVTLGEGGTPCVAAPWAVPHGSGTDVWLKNETLNPTWCSKDRGNAVSVSLGRALEAPGLVAISTGNHGASMAAYAGRAGIPAIALLSPHADAVHRAMVTAYGGSVVVSERRDELLRHLVAACGWFPVTDLAASCGPNPFGVEAYKTVAFEIFDDLGGVPDAMLVPVASGDLIYGIFKGFRELLTLGITRSLPKMIACQAAGAAALAQAFRSGAAEIPILAQPETVARSIGDKTSGVHALEAVARSGGDVVVLTDEAIVAAQQRLAGVGFLVEPASAASVAALGAAMESGVLNRDARVVCVLTGAAVKWGAQLAAVAPASALMEPSIEQISALARRLVPNAAYARR
jgi:threonine synthase